MPSSDSTSETITLRGPQEKLGLGKLIEKSQDLNNLISKIYIIKYLPDERIRCLLLTPLMNASEKRC